MSFNRLRLVLQSLLIFFVRDVLTTPSALSVTPSSKWYGADGSWSTVSIRVGTPQQWVDVMISTESSETWVISTDGCDGSYRCMDERGGLFNVTSSSSWEHEGLFLLGLDTQLGFNGTGNYGLDVLEFGSSGISLPKSIIASINTTEYLTGFLGLGIVPGNFTDGQFKSPLDALVEQNTIPSYSYGYTAGASYQQKGEPCSLTLGGYDANRIVPHNISFGLDPVQRPSVFLSSISVSASTPSSNWTSNSLDLLGPSDGIYTIIDSSTPFLWLPQSICDKLSNALGLTYDVSLQLYTFDANSSQHDALKSQGLNFTFSISDTSNPSAIVNITLPYAAFDLRLSYPYIPDTDFGSPNATKYYFPLRPAPNENQYALGRSFLQEAYIITDYERLNFSVHQAVHIADPTGNSKIIDITRPSNSQLPPPSHSHRLGRNAIIGIAVGCSVVFLRILYLFFRCYRRRRLASKRPNSLVEKDGLRVSSRISQRLSWIRRNQNRPSRLHEVPAGHMAMEIDGTPTERFELADSQVPVELHSATSERQTSHHHFNTTLQSGMSNVSPLREGTRTDATGTREEKSESDRSSIGHYRAETYEDSSDISSDVSSTVTLTNATGLMPRSPNVLAPPPPIYSPPRSVYMGPLPTTTPRPRDLRRGRESAEASRYSASQTMDSLGSGYTEDEMERLGIDEMLDLWGGRKKPETESLMEGATESEVVHARGRVPIDLVHVPVLADHRFSWEGENESGTVIGRDEKRGGEREREREMSGFF